MFEGRGIGTQGILGVTSLDIAAEDVENCDEGVKPKSDRRRTQGVQ
jgi:hypothetical protein